MRTTRPIAFAAMGGDTLAYIEIEEGPYLVLPVEKQFDSGERPINVDASNVAWLDASSLTWIDQPGWPASADGPQVAFLWGNPVDGRSHGNLIKLPAGSSGKIQSHGSTFRSVVIGGRPQVHVPNEAEAKGLEQGSYFGSTGETLHLVSSEAGEASIIDVRTDGAFEVVPA